MTTWNPARRVNDLLHIQGCVTKVLTTKQLLNVLERKTSSPYKLLMDAARGTLGYSSTNNLSDFIREKKCKAVILFRRSTCRTEKVSAATVVLYGNLTRNRSDADDDNEEAVVKFVRDYRSGDKLSLSKEIYSVFTHKRNRRSNSSSLSSSSSSSCNSDIGISSATLACLVAIVDLFSRGGRTNGRTVRRIMWQVAVGQSSQMKRIERLCSRLKFRKVQDQSGSGGQAEGAIWELEDTAALDHAHIVAGRHMQQRKKKLIEAYINVVGNLEDDNVLIEECSAQTRDPPYCR
tara:strand:- start:851 stop:1723 length:873 start_codon:yes stop_codon:yes gene_type:complete